MEYDLVYREVPQDLEDIVRDWMAAALESGAEVAWFGFEGSFHFDEILRASNAIQVFAIGGEERVELALDDVYRHSDSWAKVVGEFGANLD